MSSFNWLAILFFVFTVGLSLCSSVESSPEEGAYVFPPILPKQDVGFEYEVGAPVVHVAAVVDYTNCGE